MFRPGGVDCVTVSGTQSATAEPRVGFPDRVLAIPFKANKSAGRKRDAVNDDSMIGPGMHETTALRALDDGNVSEASVRATLALAAAVNRLADTWTQKHQAEL